mmetsp:Transcript_28204/g.62456  ORF Transcript_28204/g.62456 Transcript_28204/m.62456 type:complete len:970 (-) Transcript_28204:129-3038(-)
MFALEFCNRYCALLYTVFWLRDLVQLRSLLVSLLTTSALINNFMEVGLPAIKKWSKRQGKQGTPHPSLSSSSSPIPAKLSITSANTPANVSNMSNMSCPTPRRFIPGAQDPAVYQSSMREVLAQELSNETYDLNADYLELVIQYGYVTMFVVAFPLAPALALLNNLFESKVDLFKLAECRRSPLLQRSTIGPWQSCMEFISFLAVVSNSFLIVMVSTRFELIIPAELYAHMKTDIGRLIAMIIMEHFLLGFKLLMMYIIDDIPRWLQESVAEQHGAEKERVKRERVSAYTSKATLTKDTSKKGGLLKRMKSAGMPGLRSLSASEDVEESPSKKSQKEEVDTGEGDDLVQEAEGSLYANTWKGNSHSGESPEVRLVTEMGKQRFGFDPNYMMLLVPLPLVLESMGVTPWLYLPLAVMFFGYMQARKEKITRTVAKGIVSDAALLDMIKEELPRWTTDSEYQQMEWANYMMQKFWPMLSIVGEQKAISIGTRILGKTKTPFPVAIKKFSFGTIAPRFCGIRVHQQGVPEGVVRLDLDVRYAGDPHIVLQMGPTQVEITDMRVCTTMRCECLEFTPKMTPFKLASATMMQRPRIDFKVKVGGVDMTATETLTRMVHWMVDQVVGKVVLYPRKMFVPMGDGLSEANQDLHPVGILRITLHRGVDLIQANIFGSDPYVEIRSTREQLLKSECIYSTLNPEWEETFDVVVYDRGSQVVQFQVFDFNSAGSDKSLGTAELAVSRCIDHRKQKTLTLKDVEAGSIVLTCVYVPVGAARYGGQGGEEPLPPGSIFKGLNQPSNQDDADEDVLFDVPMAEMTSNDTLISGDLALESNEDGGQDPSLLQMAVLVISNIKLRSVKAGMGHWKPAVSFHVGTQSMKTRSQKNILNPEFDDDFVFVIRNAASVEKILVKLLDKNRGKLLSGSRQIGEVSISLYDLMNMHTGGAPAVKEKEYQLESEVGEFMIGFKMHWSPAGK